MDIEKSPGNREDAPTAPPLLPPAAPRWVKTFGIVALVLVLLFVVMHLMGRGLSGHMGHSGVTNHGEQP